MTNLAEELIELEGRVAALRSQAAVAEAKHAEAQAVVDKLTKQLEDMGIGTTAAAQVVLTALKDKAAAAIAAVTKALEEIE